MKLIFNATTKKIVFQSLLLFFIITLINFAIEVGYPTLKGKSFQPSFNSWLEKSMSVNDIVIRIIIAVVFTIYGVKRQEKKKAS